jgi:transposase-like protein
MTELFPQPQPALPAPKRTRRIPPRVREAIDAYVSGRARSITAAAKKAGLSREYLSRSLSQPHVAEFLRQKAARVVAMGAGRAAARLNELINSKSDHVSLDATRLSLGIAGIKPASDAQVNVNIDVKAGFVIDLSGRSPPIERPIKIVSPQQPAAVAASEEG